MFTKMIVAQIDPANLVAFQNQWEEAIPPIWKQQKGFVRGYLLYNSTTGRNVVVSVWESRADADDYYKTDAFEQSISKFRSYFMAPPTIEEYDIEVSG